MHIWQNREDSEHEQAIIRIIVGLLAAVYLLAVLLIPDKTPSTFISTVVTISVFFQAHLS